MLGLGFSISALAVRSCQGSSPVSSVPPAISGTQTVGQTLTVSAGTWSGTPVPSYTYQWKRAGINISGATSSTYLLLTADQGKDVSCDVTATNASGSATATAPAVAFVGNLLGSYRNIDASPWTKSAATIANPGTDAQALMETAATTGHYVRQSVSRGASVKSYRLQFDVQIGLGRSWVCVNIFNDSFGGGVAANFNVAGAALGGTYGYGDLTTTGAYSITSLGGGIYRCVRDWTHDSSPSLWVQFMSATGDDVSNFPGDVTKGVKLQNLVVTEL